MAVYRPRLPYELWLLWRSEEVPPGLNGQEAILTRRPATVADEIARLAGRGLHHVSLSHHQAVLGKPHWSTLSRRRQGSQRAHRDLQRMLANARARLARALVDTFVIENSQLAFSPLSGNEGRGGSTASSTPRTGCCTSSMRSAGTGFRCSSSLIKPARRDRIVGIRHNRARGPDPEDLSTGSGDHR